MREEDDQLYIYKLYGISTPRRFRAQKTIRNLIGGYATISEANIQKAQDLMDKKLVDYAPHAYKFLDDLKEAINLARAETYIDEMFYDRILIPMVQIKGQAAMFGNHLASDLAALGVNFIERYRRFDDDMLSLVEACANSIRVSYKTNVHETQSVQGRVIMSELQYAMKRYDEKVKKMSGR